MIILDQDMSSCRRRVGKGNWPIGRELGATTVA